MLSGTGHLSILGKQEVARAMVERSKSFLGAAVLLKQHSGNGYVWRYLLCQGIEVLLKGLLLLKSYNTYNGKLRTIGHNLLTAADHCAVAYSQRAPHGRLREELLGLQQLYGSHRLRYATGLDLLVAPESIPVARVLKRTVAVLRVYGRV